MNSDMLLNRIRMAQQGLIGVHKKLYTLEHLLPSPDPAQFAETAKSAALLSERSTASLRGFLFTTTGGMPEGYYQQAAAAQGIKVSATDDYAKTRPVFDGYKAARYSKKYLAQHEAELATYRTAKDTMNTILNGAKLPKIEALKKSRRELAGQKKALYAEYREAQRQMREAVAIKANIDHLLGITDERENKAQER